MLSKLYIATSFSMLKDYKAGRQINKEKRSKIKYILESKIY